MTKVSFVVKKEYFYKKADDDKSNVSYVTKRCRARWFPIFVWEVTSSKLDCDTDYPD